MKVLVTILLAFTLPVTFTKMLPRFSILQKMYLGNQRNGGLYNGSDVKEYLFPGKRSVLKFPLNATCILRMSAVLNVTTERSGSKKGRKGYHYFYERAPLLEYLKEEYGAPVVSNKTAVFRGQMGIMFVDIKDGDDSNDCSVLLWDGYGFHQAKGVLKHKNFLSAQLWPTPPDGCGINVNVQQSCFPSKAKVELRSGKKIPISELAIGDTVKTFSKGGEIIFSPVVTFLDQAPDYKGHYYTITTEDNIKLTLSEAHLVFEFQLKLGGNTFRSVHASQIKPGDYILVHVSTYRAPIAKGVMSVTTAERLGAFAPVTREGTMIVDGVWVSCYADIVDHDLVDSFMSPLKSLYNMAPQMLGARGTFVHGYLKQVLRPIGLRLLGKEKFYQGPEGEESGGKEAVMTSVYH